VGAGGGGPGFLLKLEHARLAVDAPSDGSSELWESGASSLPSEEPEPSDRCHGSDKSPRTDGDAEDTHADKRPSSGSAGMRNVTLRTALHARDLAKQRLGAAGASAAAKATWGYQALMKQVEKMFLSKVTQKFLSRGRHTGFARRHTQYETAHSTGGRRSSETERAGRDLALSLKASTTAFAVFESEAARNQAVQACEAGVEFRGKRLYLSRCPVEPGSVHWENFVEERPWADLRRVFFGLSCILLALTAWTLLFYLPFTWVSLSASYTYGVEPTWYYVLTFSMVVVFGNAIMYTTCSVLADMLRFQYHKNQEICYMLLYTVSCVFNVILDMIVTYCIAFLRLEGSDIRAHDGNAMSELPTVVRRVMAYGMQRELGTNLKDYAFPGTFLIPFLVEPIVAVYLPWQIVTLVVRCNSIGITAAEELLRSTPFDLSRYADIHLNVILAVLILFFPGGYNLHMFFGLAASHAWIYLYDHYRALRFSPAFVYASMDVDWVAQWMFCLPCAVLLAAFLFKLETAQDFALTRAAFGPKLGDPDMSSTGLVLLLCLACLVHVAMHTWALKRLVPLFGIKPDALECPGETYRECAERLACSFITANPVHCLRSRYIHQHDPPTAWCMKGKEHLMKANPTAGQYFQDRVADPENYQLPEWASSPKQMFQTMYRRLSGSSEESSLLERSQTEKLGRRGAVGADLEGDPLYEPRQAERRSYTK